MLNSIKSIEFIFLWNIRCPLDWIGDSICDDCANTPENNYDLGDCCQCNSGSTTWDVWCTECICLDPQDISGCRIDPETTTSGAVERQVFFNVKFQAFSLQFDYVYGFALNFGSLLCIVFHTIPLKMLSSHLIISCPSHWIGDSYCDDCANTPQNNYDNGDCCQCNSGSPLWDDWCTECICLDPQDNSGCRIDPETTTSGVVER